LYATFPRKSVPAGVSRPPRASACVTTPLNTFKGEKLPAAAPCTTIRPTIRRSRLYARASRNAIGARRATPADPSAPAMAGSAATTKTIHGTSARRPSTSRAAASTVRSTVPLLVAIAKR
jgi:hypothetical protein